jgi:hypothetical protein
MTTNVPPYSAQFQEGSSVRVADRIFLEEFMKTWKYHHPLASEQLAYAGTVATVKSVGYYHGGDQLYHLSDVPGIWHPECLRTA